MAAPPGPFCVQVWYGLSQSTISHEPSTGKRRNRLSITQANVQVYACILAQTQTQRYTFYRRPSQRVSQLVLLSPVSHKGLHQGWTQNFNLSPSYSLHKSLYHSLFFFLSLSLSLSLSNHNSNSIHNFETQNQKNNNTCFGAYLYSASTQRGNLHPAGWPILFWLSVM